MKRRYTSYLLTAALFAATAAPVSAQDEEEAPPDARVQGYSLPGNKVGPVLLDPKDARGNATIWFILAGLGVVGLGVMFKSGKRTHLD